MTRIHNSRYPNGLTAIASMAPTLSGSWRATPKGTMTAITPMTM